MNIALLGTLFFLGASLLLYVLLAGADFGAGILELTLGRRERSQHAREIISHAMAPVWEANHIWLILAVVILFMGFPLIYTQMSTLLHVPLMAILMGIVLRGCAFTFRHYDTLTPQFQPVYNGVFAVSSLWSAVWLGITAGALTLGRLDPNGDSFFALYIDPWWNTFALAIGLFTAALFTFLAAVYLVGEADTKDLRDRFRRKARFALAVMIVLGAVVFAAAEHNGLPLSSLFAANRWCQLIVILATILLVPLNWQLSGDRYFVMRGLAGAVVGLVLSGWFVFQFPIALRGAWAGGGLSFLETAAPQVTLWALLAALFVGSLLIFPALVYLMFVFKWRDQPRLER